MDRDFSVDGDGLQRACELLRREYPADVDPCDVDPWSLPAQLPDAGLGSAQALERLAPEILGRAARLGAATAFAHMDPPTPWITWAAALWNAALNQNLLHPATSPAAREAEQRIIDWLAPSFGMNGGHMTPGSSLANLTALWAARECAGIDRVIASEGAHLSIRKSAHILGLRYDGLPMDCSGTLVADALPSDLSRSAMVLTAGTTTTGAIDSLALAGRAAWTHVDAAWAGPLRLTQYAHRLNGIERADSVSVSAHKWLFQPKESALVLFRDTPKAHAAVSFEGPYLAAPNVGLLGSHGAVAIPLLATLLAWGREGIALRIERCMQSAQQLADFVESDSRLLLLGVPQTGIVVWRPRDIAIFEPVLQGLPADMASTTTLRGVRWFRNVAANPNVDLQLLVERIGEALDAATA